MKPGQVALITEEVDRIVRLHKGDGGDWFKLEVFTRRSHGEEWKIKEVSLTSVEIEKIESLANPANREEP